MSNIRVASKSKIYSEIAPTLKQYLFNNNEWTLDYNGFILLLNIISKDAPNPHELPYGKAIDGINKAKNNMTQIGVRGSYYMQQAKQAFGCMIMILDDDGKLVNKPFINKLMPHKDKNSRDKWINDCVSYLKDWQSGKSDTIFNKYENITRDSYEYTCPSIYLCYFHIYVACLFVATL